VIILRSAVTPDAQSAARATVRRGCDDKAGGGDAVGGLAVMVTKIVPWCMSSL
jgi:hypothetical protein